MSEHEIAYKVRELVIDQLGVKEEAVTPGARFLEDLGADSLDTVELVIALEEVFGLEIPDEDVQKVTTVGEISRYLEQRLDRLQAGEAVTPSGGNA